MRESTRLLLPLGLPARLLYARYAYARNVYVYVRLRLLRAANAHAVAVAR